MRDIQTQQYNKPEAGHAESGALSRPTRPFTAKAVNSKLYSNLIGDGYEPTDNSQQANPIQMVKFGKAPRFQKTFTTGTGLQGIVLGGNSESGRPPIRPEHELPSTSQLIYPEHELPSTSQLIYPEHELPSTSQLIYPEQETDEQAAASTHDEVSRTLGKPVNKDAPKGHEKESEINHGNAVSLSILKNLADARKEELGQDDAKENEYKWLIHRAAAARVTKTGVCDNFASLSAAHLKMKNKENVKLQGSMGHKWAAVGNTKVDPWEDEVHGNKPADEATGADTQLAKHPEEVRNDLDQEISKCSGIYKNILGQLSEKERTAHQKLVAMRADGGYGSLEYRRSTAVKKEADARERARKFQEKNALLRSLKK